MIAACLAGAGAEGLEVSVSWCGTDCGNTCAGPPPLTRTQMSHPPPQSLTACSHISSPDGNVVTLSGTTYCTDGRDQKGEPFKITTKYKKSLACCWIRQYFLQVTPKVVNWIKWSYKGPNIQHSSELINYFENVLIVKGSLRFNTRLMESSIVSIRNVRSLDLTVLLMSLPPSSTFLQRKTN